MSSATPSDSSEPISLVREAGKVVLGLVAVIGVPLGALALLLFLSGFLLDYNRVVVRNASSASVESVRVELGGSRHDLGSLEPGEMASVRVRIQTDSSVRIEVAQGGIVRADSAGYVTGNLMQVHWVRITDDAIRIVSVDWP